MIKDIVLSAVADLFTENAEAKQLKEVYYEDQYNWLKDMTESELKDYAVDFGVMTEEDELE